ncbi:MAG: tetratricopeptide repeat protein [Azospirillaceae bacterium]|nr:tetratricopeptide repeat protein [Azospirillaceae bacterium]
MPAVAADPVQTVYADAVRLHRLGRLDEAGAAYQQLRRLRPDAAEAAHGPGIIALQRGDAAGAVFWFHRAIVLAPAIPAYWSNLGLALENLHDWPAAMRAYRALLALTPQTPDALCNLADIHRLRGMIDTAERIYRRALRLDPANRRALTNYAQMLATTHRAADALLPYRRLARLMPDAASAHHHLACALQEAGLRDAAEAEYHHAVACDPGHVEAWFQRARLRHGQRQPDETATLYRRCQTLAPRRAGIRYHIGLWAMEQGRPGIAVAAFRDAVTLDPAYAEAWNGLGLAGDTIGRLSIALPTLTRAVRLRPDMAIAHNNLGLALMHLGEPQSAQAAFDTAAALSPDHPGILSNQMMCHQYRPGVTAPLLREVHRAWHWQPVPPPVSRVMPPHRIDPQRRLEIGLVSADFTAHPIGFFCKPLLDFLDRTQARLTCYAVARNRGPIADDLRDLARARGDRWVEAESLDADHLAARIADDGIDILIDLAGHTARNRLPVFARRAAPVQITWAGYVGTTGVATMDWLIADHFHVPPGEEAAYGERILRLPGDYVCYAPPDYAPTVGPLPALATGVITFGGCHNPAKLNRPLLTLWRRVLDRVPNSRLLLAYKFLDDPLSRGQLYQGLGLGPDRMIIEGPQPHAGLLATYQRIDIALDSHPYSGGLTTFEALWMGVPVVTLTGSSFAGRHSTSHLHHAGLGSLVTTDPEAYIDRAAALAADLPALAALRARLRPQMAASPACDGPGHAAAFLGAMRHAWTDWCQRTSGIPERDRA